MNLVVDGTVRTLLGGFGLDSVSLVGNFFAQSLATQSLITDDEHSLSTGRTLPWFLHRVTAHGGNMGNRCGHPRYSNANTDTGSISHSSKPRDTVTRDPAYSKALFPFCIPKDRQTWLSGPSDYETRSDRAQPT